MEPASWVGAGWTLNAGGVITRTVVGAPDEAGTNNAATETNGHFSHYGFSNYLNNVSGIQDWQAFADGRKDGEPDLYFFNFNGYSGKFYFHDDRTPVIVPEQDLKIEPSFPTVGASIQSFIITTPDGVRYTFGTTDITNPVTAQNGASTATAVSSWYLTKIASADNESIINLNYTPEKYGYFTIATFPVDGAATGSDANGYNLVKNVVTGVRLNTITFGNNCTITFAGGTPRSDLSDNAPYLSDASNATAQSDPAYTLGSIQISDGSFCKKFNFTYSYFEDLTSSLNGSTIAPVYTLQTDRYRLRLDKIQETSCDGTMSVPPYQFSYFAEKVPRRLTFGQDHWGFYNGITNNETLIPAYIVVSPGATTGYAGAERDAVWPTMRGGSLEQITYPTGGYSLFEFEPNSVYVSYYDYQNLNLRELTVHQYGQNTVISQTLSFTITGPGANTASVKNTSLTYNCRLSIKNSSNTEVYLSNPIDTNQLNVPLNLSPGSYQATLYYPSGTPANSSWTGGAGASIFQWQNVLHTQTLTAGGMRIKNITHNDGIIAGNNMVTSYSYLKDGHSSAVLYSRPVYVGIIRNDLIRDLGYWNAGGNGFTPFLSGNGCPSTPSASFYKSGGSIRPMATTQGYHIGYSSVQVTQTGNGRSAYDYYGTYNGSYPWQQASTDDVATTLVNTIGCDGSAPNYPPAPLPFEVKRGELQHEAHYTEEGDMLQETTYTPSYAPVAMTTTAFMVMWRTNQLLGTNYTLTNNRKTQMVTVKTDYTPGTGSTTTTTTEVYGSTFHHQPSSRTVTTTTGDVLLQNMKYAQDYRIPNCDALADGWQTYQTDLNTCRTTYQTTAANCNGNNACVSQAYLDWVNCNATKRVAYVNYRRAKFTDASNEFKTRHDAAKGAALTTLKPVLELQDEYKNPVVEISAFKKGNLVNASYTDFDYGMNSSAFVYPKTVKLLYPSSLANTFTPSAVSADSKSITWDNRYTDETLYKFDKGNLAEVKGRDGVATSYLWDNTNDLPIAKATGTDVLTLQAAYSAAGNSLTLLRSQSSISGAMLSTFTYQPIVGMTGQTDASGKTMTYEYDKLGRLLLIKDQNGNVVKKYEYKYNGQ